MPARLRLLRRCSDVVAWTRWASGSKQRRWRGRVIRSSICQMSAFVSPQSRCPETRIWQPTLPLQQKQTAAAAAWPTTPRRLNLYWLCNLWRDSVNPINSIRQLTKVSGGWKWRTWKCRTWNCRTENSVNKDYITLQWSVQFLVVIFLDTNTLMHC